MNLKNKTNYKYLNKLILKLITKQYFMHLVAYAFPIIFIPLYIGIYISLNDPNTIKTYQEIKWFIINIVCVCSFSIPFIFFILTYNRIFIFIRSNKINKWTPDYIKKIMLLIFWYFIYYIINILFIFSYYLLISCLFDINGFSFLYYLINSPDYTNNLWDNNIIVLVNNSVNWLGLFFNFIIGFIFNLCLAWLFWVLFKNKKLYWIKCLNVYIILTIIGSLWFISLYSMPRTDVFNIIYSLSPYYYIYWLINLTWCGVPLFNMADYGIITNINSFHQLFGLNIYLYVYLFIAITVIAFIIKVNTNKKIKQYHNIKYKKINEIIKEKDTYYTYKTTNKKNFIFVASYLNKIESYLLKNYLIINTNTMLFLDELSIQENIFFFQQIFNFKINLSNFYNLLLDFDLIKYLDKKFSNIPKFQRMLFNLIICNLQNQKQKIIIFDFNKVNYDIYLNNINYVNKLKSNKIIKNWLYFNLYF